jgi:hypothetical protein
VAQLAEQGGLVPKSHSVVAAVGEVYAIAHEKVKMDMSFESGPKRLHGHDDARSSLLFLVSTASMTADLGSHPTPDDAVNQPAYLSMQASVALEAFAQSHLLGQGHDQMAVVRFGQFLG